jgi:hypothetical protein
VEDELHVLFECPTIARLKYEHSLFAGFGGVSEVAKSVRLPGKMSAFLNQDPRQVAAFVSEWEWEWKVASGSDPEEPKVL